MRKEDSRRLPAFLIASIPGVIRYVEYVQKSDDERKMTMTARARIPLFVSVLLLNAILPAQQVQHLESGNWVNSTANQTVKIPASDFGDGNYGGVAYFVWEIGTETYRVKKSDLPNTPAPDGLKDILQKAVDHDRRVILTTTNANGHDGQLTSGAAL